jgi:hypothetical protein
MITVPKEETFNVHARDNLPAFELARTHPRLQGDSDED